VHKNFVFLFFGLDNNRNENTMTIDEA